VNQPLFRHPRLIATATIAVLGLVTAGALYVRPLSGDAHPANAQGKAAIISAVLGIGG
jgi:hypothetical protein